MAVFSTNQVRQLYVASELKTTPVMDTDKVGALSVQKNIDNDVYVLYKGADTLLRSDLLKKENIKGGSVTDASKLTTPMKRHKVVLNPNVNTGNPIAGQDYILRIAFKEWIGISPEDTYYKYGTVTPNATMTVAQFYKALKADLELNFSKEVCELLSFELDDETTPTCLYINELPQEWVLGLKQTKGLNYQIQFLQVSYAGLEDYWGVVTKEVPTVIIKNGQNMADLEYFCMGERGDIYRNVGFPRVIQTKYLVDSSMEYNTIDLTYFYAGDGVSVQHSDKVLTILIPKKGISLAEQNDLTNSIITAVNTATGLSLNPLPIG